MNRRRKVASAERRIAQIPDVQVISAALAATPVDEHLLRRSVWTYVGAQRHAGTPPGHVLMALTELVEGAGIESAPIRQATMRRVVLWCVEAYFGHVGGDVVGHNGDALSDSPEPTPNPSRGTPDAHI